MSNDFQDWYNKTYGNNNSGGGMNYGGPAANPDHSGASWQNQNNSNWQNVFGNQANSGNAGTMPVSQPDIYGGGSYFGAQGGYPQGYFGDPSTWDADKRFRLSNPDWSLPVDSNGRELANPNNPLQHRTIQDTFSGFAQQLGGNSSPDNFYSPGFQPTGSLNPTGSTLGYGGNIGKFASITPQPAAAPPSGSIDYKPQTGALYGNGLSPVNSGGNQPYTPGFRSTGSLTPTPAAPAPSMGMGGTNPDAGYPKFDPAYLQQVQTALEDPNGPYANRKPGDYGPIGAPDYVLNPQGDEQWKQRLYWMAANPNALSNPTQPRDLSASQYDFSKAGSVPYTVFLNNAFADTNAKQGFKELSGVLTADQLRQAQQTAGWQDAVSGLNADPNLVYRAMDTMARATPGVDFEVVKVQQPDGSIGYGLQKREQSQQAQQARGFTPPGYQAPRPAAPAPTYRATSNYQSGSPARPASPGNGQWPATTYADAMSKYQTPPAQNPANLLSKPGAYVGQTVESGGQVYRFDGNTWIKQTNNSGGGGGGAGHPQYQTR